MELWIDHVSKEFKDKRAVVDVNLKMTPGVWGLLGANGAGKTTLMRIIAGNMGPSSGTVRYDGVPIQEQGEDYRAVFGYLPQEFGFYTGFTVQDYLEYMAALKGLPSREGRRRISELLDLVSLLEVRGKRIAKLSGGMRRRVGIAQALLNDPEVLVLDEPTSGLDPGERVRFRNLMADLAQDRIVLISTHIVSDVEYIASRIAVMKEGKLVAVGTTEELVKLAEGKIWSCMVPAEMVPAYEKRLSIVSLRSQEDGTVLVRYLAERPCDNVSVSVQPRLEDLYLWLFPQGGEQMGREGVSWVS